MSADGLILFAHGARDPAWARPFEAVAQQVRAQRPALHLQLAYLERMQPDLPTAAAALAQAGCKHVAIVPLFLGSGGHVRQDLPLLVEAARQQHPGTQWTLHGAVGETPVVLQALAQASLDALALPDAAA
jgi:sirohydrochlorin cobaltochelatase